jgi:hypothetical protein
MRIARFITLALVAVALLTVAAPAQAMTVDAGAPQSVDYSAPYTPADDALLSDLGWAGILPLHGTGDDLRELAQNVCDGIAAGVPVAQIETTLGEQGWAADDAAFFVDDARAAYCMSQGVVTIR